MIAKPWKMSGIICVDIFIDPVAQYYYFYAWRSALLGRRNIIFLLSANEWKKMKILKFYQMFGLPHKYKFIKRNKLTPPLPWVTLLDAHTYSQMHTDSQNGLAVWVYSPRVVQITATCLLCIDKFRAFSHQDFSEPGHLFNNGGFLQ